MSTKTNIKLLWVFTLLTLTFVSKAQLHYYTVGSGDWANNANWYYVEGGTNTQPNLTTNTLDITISAGDSIRSLVALNFKKESTITIEAGATLILDAGAVVDILDVAKNFTLIVKPGATLVINGNVDASKEASMDIQGEATITGNLNFNGTPAGTLVVNDPGVLDVGGNIGGLVPTGTGIVIESGTVILKIELNYFHAYHKKNNVSLIWQTAMEENNDYFTIERSKDGLNYEVIGTVLGAGNSLTTLNYTYTDLNPVNGVSYYRLMQTDYDGAFEVFSPVSVSNLIESELKVGPNPVSDKLQVTFGGEMGTGVVRLYSPTGAEVRKVELNGNYTTIDVNGLPSGNYLMVITADKTNITKKIVVQ